MAIWAYFRGAEVFDIKVGYRCNNQCVHCVVDPVRRRLTGEREPEDLSTGEVENLIDAAARADVKAIVLTGGEVTIREDFVHLLRYATARRLKIVIQTNGRILSNKTLCERLSEFPDLLLVVALHASNPEIHDRITRCRGSFAQTCEAIRNLRAIGKEVAAKIVLSKLNRGELMGTARLARELGVNEFCVVFPHALDFPQEQFLEVVPSYGEIQTEVREACLYAEAEGFPMTFETIPYCIVPDEQAYWRRSCDLHSSTLRRREQDTTAANAKGCFDWESLRPAMKEKASACSACVFDPICEGPWREYVDAYGFGEFRPVLPQHVATFLAAASSNDAPEVAAPGAQTAVRARTFAEAGQNRPLH